MAKYRHGPIEAYLAAEAAEKLRRIGRKPVADALARDPSLVSKWRRGVWHASIDELVTIYLILGLDLRETLQRAVEDVYRPRKRRAKLRKVG